MKQLLVLLALAACNKTSPCEQFVIDSTDCYDSFCGGDGASTAFCGCWNDGKDLNVTDCTCIPLDLEVACELYDLSDYEEGTLDCPTASDALSNMCPAS